MTEPNPIDIQQHQLEQLLGSLPSLSDIVARIHAVATKGTTEQRRGGYYFTVLLNRIARAGLTSAQAREDGNEARADRQQVVAHIMAEDFLAEPDGDAVACVLAFFDFSTEPFELV